MLQFTSECTGKDIEKLGGGGLEPSSAAVSPVPRKRF